MNKHVVITGIAIVVMISPFVYSGLNIYAIEQIQYKWENVERFNFFAMSNGGHVEFCNITPTWIHIKDFQIDLFYDMKNLGKFNVERISIDPLSSTFQNGRFVSDTFIETQHVFMALDHQFDGGGIGLDPTRMYVLVTIDAPIIGLVPYTISTQHTGFDFDGVMKGNDFKC